MSESREKKKLKRERNLLLYLFYSLLLSTEEV